ncbi:hypothetical protein LRS40_03900 [Leclercia sp. G3L]|uniref:hypothetical protein n=1 Tax=Leclercia sp. G3L TaxID=2898725 RepID=UPI001E2F67BC|nr:hypothetical protein [Leclercia sp. G3L]UGB03229.1 hypothetical protein LRS40_03900 [Leclercia sp. G3L]
MGLFVEHGGFLWHCRVALRLPGLRFGAAVAEWRFAYPAYGSVLLLPGGASLTRPTVRCCCAGWRFAYPTYGSGSLTL